MTMTMPRLPAVRRRRRVPFVPQMEMAECGAACLAMVLGHFGRHVPLAELRIDCGVGRDGVNAQGLSRAAARHGLLVRASTSSLAQLAELPAPMIVHWDFNHFIVIERVSKKGARVLDPAHGRRRASWRELDDHFTGVVLTFAPGPDFRPRAAPAGSLGRYWSQLLESRSAVGLLLVSALLLQLLVISFPSVNQVLIDHVLPPRRVGWLWAMLGVVAGASLARVVFTWFRGRTLALLHTALDLDLMARFTDKLFQLPAVFFDQRTPGDLLHRVEANVQLSTFSARLVTASLDLLVLFALAGLMLAYDPLLALITLTLSLGRVISVAILQQRVRQTAASELALRGRETSVVVDALSMPELVRAFGLVGTLVAKHTNCVIRRANATLALRRDAARVVHGSAALDGLARALLLYLGGCAVLDDRMSIGAFVGILTLQSMLDAPLTSVVQAVTQLSYVRGLLARMGDVLDASAERHGSTRPPRLRGEIVLHEVSYQFSPRAPKVCDRISLRIEAGQKVAIVGRSGAGKSTMAKIMVGLISPQAGEVRIDGIPLTVIDVEYLRRNTGVVLQEPFLFDASVRANVDLAGERLPPGVIRRALEIACLDRLVDSLPRGLASPVGERGRRLSGGQRQRLVLARAVARQPAILLLDEATSSLDPETEAQVHQNLARLACTRIVVAHRLATVRDADRVLVLEGGKIADEGTYEELVARPGPFLELAGELR